MITGTLSFYGIMDFVVFIVVIILIIYHFDYHLNWMFGLVWLSGGASTRKGECGDRIDIARIGGQDWMQTMKVQLVSAPVVSNIN